MCMIKAEFCPHPPLCGQFPTAFVFMINTFLHEGRGTRALPSESY
jgi:hypothetical protein